MTEFTLGVAIGGAVLIALGFAAALIAGRPTSRDYVEGAVAAGYTVSAGDELHLYPLAEGGPFVVHLDGVGTMTFDAFDDAFDTFAEVSEGFNPWEAADASASAALEEVATASGGRDLWGDGGAPGHGPSKGGGE